MTKLKWYTKSLHPWGVTIGTYEEAFPRVLGEIQRVTRHRTKQGRIRHYATSYTGKRTDGTYGVMWFKNLKDTLAFLEHAVKTGLVAPT